MGLRQCPACGRYVLDHLTQCPHCREPFRAIQSQRVETAVETRPEIRRGLLYMFLAAVLYYFVGGHSPWSFPIPSLPIVTDYLVPFLFLCGLGLTLYGLYRRWSD